ncbi:hypothetical protein BDV98DRAFT_248766 [Pterulicium gracile]|uniref:Uncharacterized protein n=1 Tax=Pterulicium gracile TaxID=1884261 RepID=A0A5C3Q795_9AGAR|nr:hypothetical protein BDV98DRAFT_248766 [Pterula gracilis]
MTLAEMGLGAVQPSEAWWREHYSWLLEQGFQLCQRYKLDWVPSWKDRGVKQVVRGENGQSSSEPIVLDATRLKDGHVVALKRIRSSRSRVEIEISLFFSSLPLATVPVRSANETRTVQSCTVRVHEQTRLHRRVHDTMSTDPQKPRPRRTKYYTPLESNPEIFTSLISDLGLSSLAFTDGHEERPGVH